MSESIDHVRVEYAFDGDHLRSLGTADVTGFRPLAQPYVEPDDEVLSPSIWAVTDEDKDDLTVDIVNGFTKDQQPLQRAGAVEAVRAWRDMTSQYNRPGPPEAEAYAHAEEAKRLLRMVIGVGPKETVRVRREDENDFYHGVRAWRERDREV